MAPMISVDVEKKNELKKINKLFKQEKEKLINIRSYIEKNFEYVGENFSKKVREIYYDKKSKKNLWYNNTKGKRGISRRRY